MKKIYYWIKKNIFADSGWGMIFFLICLALISSMLVVLNNVLETSEGLLFLHYTVYFGPDYFGSWKDLYVFPQIGVVFLVVNYTIANLAEKRKQGFAVLITGMNLFLQILTAMAFYLVVYNNY